MIVPSLDLPAQTAIAFLYRLLVVAGIASMAAVACVVAGYYFIRAWKKYWQLGRRERLLRLVAGFAIVLGGIIAAIIADPSIPGLAWRLMQDYVMWVYAVMFSLIALGAIAAGITGSLRWLSFRRSSRRMWAEVERFKREHSKEGA